LEGEYNVNESKSLILFDSTLSKAYAEYVREWNIHWVLNKIEVILVYVSLGNLIVTQSITISENSNKMFALWKFC
jgi:hypothetical protein